MSKFEVIFFEKNDGTAPAEEFLLALDIKMRAKLAKEIELLQDVGNELPNASVKPLNLFMGI